MGDDLDSRRKDNAHPRFVSPPPKTTKRRPIRSNLGPDAACATLLGSVLALQRAQKVEQVLLLLLRQLVLEELNHGVRL